MDIMPPENQLPPHHAPTGLKLWLAIFGVVLVVALGYLVWVSNTTPDTKDDSTLKAKQKSTVVTTGTSEETKGWKSYSNSDLSFSYPQEWYYGGDSEERDGSRQILFTTIAGDKWIMQLNTDATSLTTDQFTDNYISTQGLQKIALTRTATKIDSLTANEVVDGTSLHTFMVKDGKAITLAIDTSNKATYTLILSSFKFTK